MSLSGCRSESVMMRGMVIDMEEARLHTLAQVTAFLDGTAAGTFRVPKAERYRFIEPVRKRFGAARHGRAVKGVFLGDIKRMTLLVRPYRKDGKLSNRHRVHPTTASPAFYRHGRGRAGRNRCPFAILGFHTNNGSESINYQVAGLLETLRVEFTTSRSRHSNDTAWRSPRAAQSCANIWALPKLATRRRPGQ
jgi:hypothetical protein